MSKRWDWKVLHYYFHFLSTAHQFNIHSSALTAQQRRVYCFSLLGVIVCARVSARARVEEIVWDRLTVEGNICILITTAWFPIRAHQAENQQSHQLLFLLAAE